MGQDIKESVVGILVHLEWKLQGLPTLYGHERKTDYYFDKMIYFIMQLYSNNCVHLNIYVQTSKWTHDVPLNCQNVYALEMYVFIKSYITKAIVCKYPTNAFWVIFICIF